MEPQEINNLKKFGNIFQSKCISCLISDKVFLERIVDILSPDFFETDAHKYIVRLAMEYFPKYRDVPTMEVFKVEILRIQDPVLQAAVFEQVKAGYKYIPATDLAYTKEQFLEFCKNQKLKNILNYTMRTSQLSIFHLF